MVIAIDGPAGSGKSTIAQLIAERMRDGEGKGFHYINSGKLYRAITLGCLRAGIDPLNSAKVLEFAKNAIIVYDNGRVLLDNEEVTSLLHTDEIDRWAAPLSAHVPVRHIVNDHIRAIAQGLNVVVEGRDMTTVVFPHAQYRFYLDASAAARAQRRFDQGVSQLTQAEIQEAIIRRDTIDQHKAEGSLVIAPGVIYIDTSGLTINQVYDILIETIKPETRTEHGADGSGIGH